MNSPNSKAELASWGGDAEEARRQVGVATTYLGDDAEHASIRAAIHDVLGYLADDLREARTHRVAAWQAATEAGHVLVVAQALVGVADLALRSEFLGLGSALPRAVPSDAVVATLGAALPGMLLQKLVLVGSLLAAATGQLLEPGRARSRPVRPPLP